MTFNELNLSAPVLRAVAQAGYESPSPIQAAAIPPVLAGRDLMGCAQTGTGKTAAFALPMLDRLPAITPCTWFRLFLTVTAFLLFLALFKGLSHCSIQFFPKFLRYRKADILIDTLPLFIGLFRLIGRHCHKESVLSLQQ